VVPERPQHICFFSMAALALQEGGGQGATIPLCVGVGCPAWAMRRDGGGVCAFVAAAHALIGLNQAARQVPMPIDPNILKGPFGLGQS